MLIPYDSFTENWTDFSLLGHAVHYAPKKKEWNPGAVWHCGITQSFMCKEEKKIIVKE